MTEQDRDIFIVFGCGLVIGMLCMGLAIELYAPERSLIDPVTPTLRLTAVDSRLYFYELTVLNDSVLDNCTIYTQLPIHIRGANNVIKYTHIYGGSSAMVWEPWEIRP